MTEIYMDVTCTDKNERGILLKITGLMKNIKYGYIQITIQNGKVVQIDKTEKFRLPVCRKTEMDKIQYP